MVKMWTAVCGVHLVDLGVLGWCGGWEEMRGGDVTTLLSTYSVCSSAIDLLLLAVVRALVTLCIVLRYDRTGT
jgi:hypothetical protein